MTAGYSTAAVTMGHLALKRAIRHAEANDLVARNVAILADTPKGQPGRPSKSLTLNQAAAVITAARTLPVMELRPGLKDVRRPAALMHAYIVLSLLAGIRTEEAQALRWSHVDLDGDPAARPPVPPHVAVWRSVRTHGETKTERSRRTLGLAAVAVQALRTWSGSQAGERLAAGDSWQDTGLVFTSHLGAALGRGKRPENVQKGLHRGRDRGQLDPARAADHVRQPAEPPRGQHRGDRPAGGARLHPHHRDRLPTGTTARHHHRRRDHGRALQRNLAPAGPGAAEDQDPASRRSLAT
jgi:integrase